MNALPVKDFVSYPVRQAKIWRRRDLWGGLLFSLPPAIAYFWTLQRGVGWWDSGELIAAAKTLSIAHRPGFPLYILGGHMCFGWLSDPRWTANALSAVCAVAALLFIWRAFQFIARPNRLSALWIGAGGWLVASAPLYWRQAIRAEVYAPAFAVLALAFLLAVAAQHAPDPRAATRRFLAAAYLAGLAFCLHSALAVSVWPVLALLFVTANFRPSLRQWLGAASALLLGLSVYLYVPLRAPHAPYVWGDPSTFRGFIAYLTASDSFGAIASGAGGTLLRIGELVRVVWENVNGLLFTVGAVGLLIGLFSKRAANRLPWVLALTSLAISATVVSHVIDDNFDLQAYLFPLLWVVWWGWTKLDPLAVLEDDRVGSSGRRIGTAVIISALVLTNITAGAKGKSEVEPASLGMADVWGRVLLSSAKPGDLIVVQDANTDFLLRGIMASLPQMHEITVLNTALAPAPWYRQWWTKRHLADEAPGIDSNAPTWSRDIARWWRENRGRVHVDYGTPGWTAAEIAPAGWLGRWTEPSLGPGHLPVLDVPRAVRDPDWVRTAVLYYYRLGTYYADRGQYSRASASWSEGLRWAPSEPTLLERLAQTEEQIHAAAGQESEG